MTTLKDRILGAQLGSAIGDALGAPLEFLPPRPKDKWVTEMIGGGVLQWNPGDTITDDTFMNLTIADMYSEKKEYNQIFLIKKWLDWKNISNPKDMGNWTYKALSSWDPIDHTEELRGTAHPVIKLWADRGKKDAGNGGVMRCIPSALAVKDLSVMLDDTGKICEDSHPDPRCLQSCLTINHIVYKILNGADKKEISRFVTDVSKAVGREFGVALNEAEHLPYEHWSCSGYTIDTVRCALACFLQSDNFEDALVALVNRGNDSDTVGAVAGGLLGSFYGIDSIPKRWIDQMKGSDRIFKSADDLYNLRES